MPGSPPIGTYRPTARTRRKEVAERSRRRGGGDDATAEQYGSDDDFYSEDEEFDDEDDEEEEEGGGGGGTRGGTRGGKRGSQQSFFGRGKTGKLLEGADPLEGVRKRKKLLAGGAVELKSAADWRLMLDRPGNEPMVNRLRDALVQNGARIIDLLRHWDRDNDGQLSKAEFRTALRKLGCPAAPRDMNTLFKRWDADDSGMISLLELHKILRRGGNVEKQVGRRRRHDSITQEEIRKLPAPPASPQEKVKYNDLSSAVQKARLSFVAHAMNVGKATAKDLLSIAASSVVHQQQQIGSRAEALASGSGRGSPPRSPTGGMRGSPHTPRRGSFGRTPSGGVASPGQKSKDDEDEEKSWLDVRDSSARAAGMLIDSLREKGRASGGMVNRRQFVEALQVRG